MKLNTTQVQFLNEHLRGTGRVLTEAVAAKKYGILNLRARATDLRQAGLVVNVSDGEYTIPARDASGSRKKLVLA